MNKKSTAILVAITLIVVVAAFVAVNQRTKSVSDDPQERYLLSNLRKNINDVTQIDIVSGADHASIKIKDNQWVVSDRNNYPANIGSVKDLVFGLSNMIKVEAKTKKAENYAKLGVDDPKTENSTSTLLTLLNAKGEKLVELIVGNDRTGGGSDMRYVRLANDKQAWLVKSALKVELLPSSWLEKSIVNIPRNNIKQLTITQNDGAQLILAKEAVDTQDHIVSNLPKGKELKARFEPRNITAVFENLTLEDVQAGDAMDFESLPQVKVACQTFDGLVLNATIVEKDGLHYAKFTSSFDPALRPETKIDQANIQNPQPPSPATKNSAGIKDVAAVQEEVASIGERVKQWIYVIPKAKSELMTKKLADMIKVDEKPKH